VYDSYNNNNVTVNRPEQLFVNDKFTDLTKHGSRKAIISGTLL